MIRFLLLPLLIALALPSQAQQQRFAPSDYARYRTAAARYDSLLTEHNDLKRYAVVQQHRLDTLRIDLASSNAGNAQMRRVLFNEIDYNQSLELNLLSQKKERARLERKQRRRNARLARASQRTK
jgi:hypothetical protein